jgi:anti-sigma regulatory factor (Ser/Thr protein kinase)
VPTSMDERSHSSGTSLPVHVDPEDVIPAPTQTFGNRGFWIIFVTAWLAYVGLTVAMGSLEDEPLRHILLIVPAPAALTALIGWRRQDLVTDQRTLLRTTGLLVVVGVLYCILSALLSLPLLAWFASDVESIWVGGPALLVLRLSVYSSVLYVIFAGFLMWSESLERIQESRTMAAQAAVLRARAESKALRAQFNPHFVFNTLHSLMLLVREDPSTAERAIEDVASLIRYASTLERRGQDTVPLGQELEVARRYVALEALRLEDRLGVVWKVDAELERMAVPAFALQTLLENAIKHGLSPKPEGGKITIQVSAEGRNMVLTVADDGMGADSGEMARSGGSGLTLLEHRLASLYGDAASLAWHTEPGKGFSVMLHWPMRPVTAQEEGKSE